MNPTDVNALALCLVDLETVVDEFLRFTLFIYLDIQDCGRYGLKLTSLVGS